MSESNEKFNCDTCKKAKACSEGLAYSIASPYRFGDYKDFAFEFCPNKLLEDIDFVTYFYQIFALTQGINTFGDDLTFDDLESLFTLDRLQANLIKRQYAEFWAKALGGKK